MQQWWLQTGKISRIPIVFGAVPNYQVDQQNGGVLPHLLDEFVFLDFRKEQQANHILKVHFLIWRWECFCLSPLATADSYSSARASSRVSPAHSYLVLQKTQLLQEQDPQAWRKSAFPFANHYTAAGFSFRFHMKLCSLSARLIFDGFG